MISKIILFSSCILAVCSDMMLVLWSKNIKHEWWLFVGAILLNILGIIIWCYSMRKGIESAQAITIYAIFTVAGCSLIGHILFKEELSTVNVVGLILSLLSVILVRI